MEAFRQAASVIKGLTDGSVRRSVYDIVRPELITR